MVRPRNFRSTHLPRHPPREASGGAAIRRDLSHLEVRLSSSLLKRITLIDTPGLNSTNALHTEATTSFVRRADAIIWLLASGQAGTASEDADIKRLAKAIKPLVVVNQIDQIDEEEESVEDTLKRIGKRLGIETPMGISALCGLEAMEGSNDELLVQSGWKSFEERLDVTLRTDANLTRADRLKSRLQALVVQVDADLKRFREERDRASRDASGGQDYADAQSRALESLTASKQSWNNVHISLRNIRDATYYGDDEPPVKQKSCYQCGGSGRSGACPMCKGSGTITLYPVVNSSGQREWQNDPKFTSFNHPVLRGRAVSGILRTLSRDAEASLSKADALAPGLNQKAELEKKRSLLIGHHSQLSAEIDRQKSRADEFASRRSTNRNGQSECRSKRSEYEKKTFFVRWLESDEFKAVEAKEASLKLEEAALNAEEESLVLHLDSLGRRLARLAGEGCELIDSVLSGTDQAIAQHQANIQNRANLSAQAATRAQQLSWVENAIPIWKAKEQAAFHCLEEEKESHKNTFSSEKIQTAVSM